MSAPGPGGDAATRLNASAVALDRRALLILGPSGSGKSALALDLMALGAELLADDQVLLSLERGHLVARSHPNIAGRIEARHLGILRLPYCESAEVVLAVDLGQIETHRLPPHRSIDVLGQKVTLLHRPPAGNPASAILHCLRHGRDTP
ncbi:HPr kinase/phosphorylase [Tropicimonas sp. IMCC6043]|uniref:HPr kinase/phosphorylase n=1 Tax=Tropicimonas sp. IMCC6043 TaxID=2510645 RepID=UPI00101B65A2|nr:serine kinase [Tropicimonas sp. IMCC6043]RYH11757.1 serine kinase [Tropicimonas sp. IMCC6043]